MVLPFNIVLFAAVYELHRVQLRTAHSQDKLHCFACKRGDIRTVQPFDFTINEVTIDVQAIIDRKAFDGFAVLIQEPDLCVANGVGIDIQL
jgi:hypothetical protein